MSIESRSRQFGKVFDHWQIKEFLGQGSGGKSAVFRLVHSGSTTVKSALKVISLVEEQGDLDQLPDFRKNEYAQIRQQRMDYAEQEVLLMNGLQGRTNVVDYLDHAFVDWSDEKGFGCDMLIRMELLKDLRGELLKGRQFSETEVLKIGRDICTALILCHSKNILHRDIKPENIFFNDDGNYKLGDFGISRIISSAPMSLASTGIGTPQYWAPEQISGSYDKRVDIYSLGLVLYELSNRNRLPFATSTYIVDTEVQKRMLGTPIPAPGNASRGLTAVILKACAYKPADRYQTAQDLLDALNALTYIQGNSEYTTIPAKPESPYATQKAAPDLLREVQAPEAATQTTEKSTANAVSPTHSPSPAPTAALGKWIAAAVVLAVIAASLFFFFGKMEDQKDPDEDISVQSSTEASSTEASSTEAATIHEHTWNDATCTSPKTCSTCGETEGMALDHQWMAATTVAPKTCSLCGATEGSPILDIVVGDTITMGHYGNEDIVWTVLEFDPATNQALVISKYCIEAMPFHAGTDYGSWENSTLRKWLNNDFISKAFSQDERATILTTTISNPDNMDYGTDSGGDTSDRVFLLSYEEAVYYFPSKTSRQGTPTKYCKEQGCYDPVKYAREHGKECPPEEVGHTWWWLRTAGHNDEHTCNVISKGTASTYGAYKTSDEGTVRPVMRVQLG